MTTFEVATRPTLLIKTTALATVPERLTARVVSLMQRYGTTKKILVTTSEAHGYHQGARVYITGNVATDFNTPAAGTLITAIVSSTTFWIMLPGATASEAGTVACYADIFVRSAIILGNKGVRTGNTGTVYLGTEAANDTQPLAIATGVERQLVPPYVGDIRYNLADFYLDVATNADGVVILYN